VPTGGHASTVSSTEVRHPLFARFFNRFAGLMERELGDRRRKLLAGLSGRVLEVGAGNGMNFRHYPATVAEVVALEPEAYLRGQGHSGISPRMAGGCHCARDTVAAIEAAGFEIERVSDFGLGPSWGITHPHVIGVARA
jgi:hypothetical protein